MSVFRARLAELQPTSREGRRWLYVPYDQLSDEIGPLARAPADELGIVLIESRWKAARRPYHKQKLAWILASQRHFALEQARRGVAVEYRQGDESYGQALAAVAAELGPLRCQRPAERELREDLAAHLPAEALSVVEHEGWLTSSADFAACASREGWRMDAFYRAARRRTGILMDARSKPLGGRFSFDGENRERWTGAPPAPARPRFEPDEVSAEVAALIRADFAHHPGELDIAAIPARREQVEEYWGWVRERCLRDFGPYEDAMSLASRTLFHTGLSPLLNLHRLLPRRVVAEVEAMELPLNSKEGFIRQVLGWREFVRHVHEASDGFRDQAAIAEAPGDGGYGRWAGQPWAASAGPGDGGACPSALDAQAPLPPAFWGERSGLRCLDEVVAGVWQTGQSHHITRLMILSNIATLLDISPRELCDWFWVAYTDAFDWVVEPNVLGMGTWAVGGRMTTKPYVSGANYIAKMSDYCDGCAFDPKRSCPLTPMYWAFLARHKDELARNPRLKLPLASLRKRAEEKRAQDAATYARVARALRQGEALDS